MHLITFDDTGIPGGANIQIQIRQGSLPVAKQARTPDVPDRGNHCPR